MIRGITVAIAVLAASCSSGDESGPCGGASPPSDCADVAGHYEGSWTVVGGDFDGFSGSYAMDVDSADCAISGELDIAGEPATMSGRLCDATSASVSLRGDLGRGSASLEFGNATMTGNFTVTITRPATSVFDPRPGTYTGTVEGARTP